MHFGTKNYLKSNRNRNHTAKQTLNSDIYVFMYLKIIKKNLKKYYFDIFFILQLLINDFWCLLT
jgi:hypothetical protein